MNTRLSFRMVGVGVEVDCPTAEVRSILLSNWGGLIAGDAPTQLRYVIHQSTPDGYTITNDGRPPLIANDSYELIYELEKSATVAVERLRRDLFFLHAAAIERDGRGFVLVAPSGSGKSTTAWALLHHGFNYLSDELAPIDIRTMTVVPYPHAVCMKRTPPEPYTVPVDTLYTGATLHVPVSSLPARVVTKSLPLGGVLFIGYQPAAPGPSLRRITAAEASARLYANALNQLAHENAGIDAALRIAGSVPCFDLKTADLEATCDLVNESAAEMNS